jgi:hypothetical protein
LDHLCLGVQESKGVGDGTRLLHTSLFSGRGNSVGGWPRPCFECRRSQAVSYRDAWTASQDIHSDGKPMSVSVIDEQLHRERLTDDYFKKDKTKVTYQESYAQLPDGVFVEMDKMPYLIWHRQLYLWTPAGYAEPIPIPETPTVKVLTPRSTVGAIAYGYRPVVHESAQ